MLVEAERLRPGLEVLLAEADYVVTSAHFPQDWTGEGGELEVTGPGKGECACGWAAAYHGKAPGGAGTVGWWHNHMYERTHTYILA